MKRIVATFGCLVVLSGHAAAQIPDRLERALTAIYGRNECVADSFGPVVWFDDGTRYATMSAEGLIAYDTPTA